MVILLKKPSATAAEIDQGPGQWRWPLRWCAPDICLYTPTEVPGILCNIGSALQAVRGCTSGFKKLVLLRHPLCCAGDRNI